MRRIAIALILLAAVAGIYACAADAPTNPGGGGGGPITPSALLIQLFTSDANPKAGTCTQLEAIVTFHGAAVADGTSVAFATDFGTFGQNGLPLISAVTTNGAAVTALCGPGAAIARVRAQATVSGQTAAATILIIFQPDSGTLPFVSSCSPSFGSTNGGENLTLNGGRFFGSASTTRVQFTANGVTRDGIVTGVGANAITVQTPGFPELTSPVTPAEIRLTLGTNLSTPVVLSLPNCFAYGTTSVDQPTLTALLPSSGTNEGNTRVTIIGSGFDSVGGVQVLFGVTKEATIVSVSFNQVVVLSPKPDVGDANSTVGVTVRNIVSGKLSNILLFRYGPALEITAASNTTQFITGLGFSPVTIYGQGFQAPVAVTLAGIPASVMSVAATEIVVMPGLPLVASCGDISGPIEVVAINSGDSATGPTFTYVVPDIVITAVSPTSSCPDALLNCPANGLGGVVVTISGTNLPPTITDADVKFGSNTATVTAASSTSITVMAPLISATAPVCTGGNAVGTPQTVSTVDITVTSRTTTCTTTFSGFRYQMPCVPPPTPTP